MPRSATRSTEIINLGLQSKMKIIFNCKLSKTVYLIDIKHIASTITVEQAIININCTKLVQPLPRSTSSLNN